MSGPSPEFAHQGCGHAVRVDGTPEFALGDDAARPERALTRFRGDARVHAEAQAAATARQELHLGVYTAR
jgi:hypothetical protein